MEENRRGNNRRPEALEMSVKSDTGENRTYTTLNVSDNGIFLLATIPDRLPVGTEVTVIPTRFKGGPQEISIKKRERAPRNTVWALSLSIRNLINRSITSSRR